MRGPLILGAAIALPVAALAATVPSALSNVAGGLWEVSGAPGIQAPIRQCFADVMTLAQFEHRTRNCSRTVLTDKGSSVTINYRCGPADFGQSEVDVITPRSLRIATQGISAQLPFNYVIQARRVGDCEKSASSQRH
ncbi:MAG TPA: hypothetical protein VN713_11800 [Sphingomicrobium sp.]|jgi:hypothetical protein|nr:hypothetical protein [Sphingomicrobium sp.]